MNRRSFLFSTAVFVLLGCANIAVAQQTEFSVSFRAVSGDAERLITAVNGCGGTVLNSSSSTTTVITRFTLVDKDGGDLEPGDVVMIKCGNKYWKVIGDQVKLAGGLADNAAKFTVESHPDPPDRGFIKLKAHDGSYVLARPNENLNASTSTDFGVHKYSVLDLVRH